MIEQFQNMIILNSIFTWISLIVFCIIFTTISIFFVYKFTKKPEKLVHKPDANKNKFDGILKDLSENLRNDKKLKQYDSSIKNTIIMMFFHKIEEKKEIKTDKLVEMKKNNSQELFKIIGDKDIFNFIQNFDEKKLNKQKYLKEISMILDKMEAWE